MVPGSVGGAGQATPRTRRNRRFAPRYLSGASQTFQSDGPFDLFEINQAFEVVAMQPQIETGVQKKSRL